MRTKKFILRLVFAVCILAFILGVYVIVNLPNAINDYGHRLMCQNTLDEIAQALERYRTDHEGVYPPNLVDVGTYMEGKYARGSGYAPLCPGGRGDDETASSSDYVYQVPPSDDRIVPICWDSTPHRSRLLGLPDAFSWNVLYSDGHVEKLNEREFQRELPVVVDDRSGVRRAGQ